MPICAMPLGCSMRDTIELWSCLYETDGEVRQGQAQGTPQFPEQLPVGSFGRALQWVQMLPHALTNPGKI